ncbi:MAG: 2'-5' RNA ligase family protein [Blastomonas sp.]
MGAMNSARTYAPLILTALMSPADFAWANDLRRRHFPPERNVVDAHITLFHQLPPQYLDDIERAIAAVIADNSVPSAMITGLINLGRGVAYRVESPELMAIREELAERYHGLLTAQDQGRPRLHITVQNKVPPAEARTLFEALSREFIPRPLGMTGLALWRYLDGPWEAVRQWRFRR